MTESSKIERAASWLTQFVDSLETLADGEGRAAFDSSLAKGAQTEDMLGPVWSNLSEPERRILLVALAPELDVRIPRLFSEVTESMSLSRPTVAACLFLAAATMLEQLEFRPLLMPGGNLIEGGWVQVEPSGSRTWLESEVRVSPAAVQLLLDQPVRGIDRDSLSRIWEAGPDLSEVVLPEATSSLLDTFLRRASSQSEGDRSLVLLLSGPSGTGKTLTARATAERLGRPLLLVDPIGGMLRRDELETRLERLSRQARLVNGILFFDECEGWYESRMQGDRTVLRLLELLDRQNQVVILATNMPDILDPALDRRVAVRMELTVPPRNLRQTLWDLHLRKESLESDVDTAWLAERYELTGGHIANAASAARQSAVARSKAGTISASDLEDAADLQIRHRLSRLAVETPTNLGLNDLIVPEDVRGKLDEIIAAVRNRRMLFEEWGFGKKLSTGRGLCMLFRGDPGTGKTLSAEVLASELKLPLYRASIPKIVSKYVGETERNLERTFREATAARGILLFDEADALFSKRVEVSSAQDRYSNMEVNLLLQEIERFDGVVILTTNLKAAIDDAFERRLNFKIDFPFPEAEHRTLIWGKLLPAETPQEAEIDFGLLGEVYELSGGSIKNVVLRAAYIAAQRDILISTELLEEASKVEYRELGKLVSDRWD